MSQGIVFKQWFKPANLPSTAVLNVKHLNYIATRKGAIRNPDCAFGLWGKLPGQTTGRENINHLTTARTAVRVASQSHTLYRAIFSLDGETAASRGFYERAAWQKLVTEQIGVLAKEMNISPSDFCWAASMHYSKGHPHVHVLYWDNSSKVRQEVVPKERFEILAERVRAAFDRELFHEEIMEARTEAKETVAAARLELTALCREANVAQALNLDHISAIKLNEVGEGLITLMYALPQKGSLKSQFQNGAFGQQLDTFLDEVMKISDFRNQEAQYVRLSKQISALHGNTANRQEFQAEAAREQFRTDLRNSVLDVLRDTLKELQADVPGELDELRVLIQNSMRILIPANPRYAELLQLFPKLRTPIREIEKDSKFMEVKTALVHELCNDLRVRAKLRGYVNAQMKAVPPGADTKQAWATLTHEAERKLYGTINHAVLDKLEEDAGYQAQRQADIALNFLIRLFGKCSQGTGQKQAQRDLAPRHGRELSKTAKKDRLKQMEQDGGWSMGQ